MPDTPKSTIQIPETVHRTVRLRLYPGDADTGHYLAGLAGACRYVWNTILADCERRYELWRAYKIGPKPSVSAFTPYKRFTILRNDPNQAWLQDYPFASVRYTLKYMADAYSSFFKDQVRQGAPDGVLGVDRNVGQATDSENVVHRMTDTSPIDANIKRKQRKMFRQQKGSNRHRRTGGQLRKLHRKRRRTHDNDTHQVSRTIADTAHTVALEDLNTKAMTRIAKGTVEKPGRNVKAKAGLNRSILASGWGQLERKLGYKAGRVVKVDPAYTSQAGSVCGYTNKSNRPSQAVFVCGACGFQANADHNAAVNILVRAGLPYVPAQARGTGASARRGAFPPWLAHRPAKGTPMTREPDSHGVNHCA